MTNAVTPAADATDPHAIPVEKVAQAAGILAERDIDVWMTFVRETSSAGDPVLPLILGHGLTWPSALIITRTGASIALVGRYEDDAVRRTGAWSEVVSYVEGLGETLRATLDRLDPKQIAVNWSRHDATADGLGHGTWLMLMDLLEGTPYAERLISAEGVIGSLRGRKTPSELDRIHAAIRHTDAIFRDIAAVTQVGDLETLVSERMHALADAHGVGTAWDRAQCPIVTTGPDSDVGHAFPSAHLSVTPGRVFHLDFGVQSDDYCSDVQRCWYVPGPGVETPSDSIIATFDAIRASILAGRDALQPGVELWTVDEAARSTLVGRGYPAYAHGTGHQVGRAAHDGGGLACPRWERYGDAVYRHAEVGQVFTLELGVEHPEAGYIGLEEMVRVTEDGCAWLTAPQDRLWTLGETIERVC